MADTEDADGAAGARDRPQELVSWCLDQIERIDPLVNTVCTPNPYAKREAAERNPEAAGQGTCGPLHGRPVLIKDNIDTGDLLTTAGSLALSDAPPPRDAALVRRLRDAGLVVLGKANLTEWANIRSSASTSGWSAYGGLTRNPYALNRSPGGSSSGSAAAVAARLTPYAVGTETDGSITCPAAFNGCVGIKPTVGLLPTDGVVPVAGCQDAPGVFALTVADAAALLTVLATGAPKTSGTDYAAYAVDGRLPGKRIGVPRATYWGNSPLADAAAERALSLLSTAGAKIVDSTDLESMAGFGLAEELHVMLAELAAGMSTYLATRTEQQRVRTLADVVAFNKAHADEELCHFGQDLFERALQLPGIESLEYARARAACLRAARDEGIDKVLADHDLDALVTPSYAPAHPIDLVNPEPDSGGCTRPAAMAGYPLLTVPSRLAHDLPVAVTFWGTAGSEATLVEIAHGYESARDAADGPLPAPTFPAFV